MESTNTSDLEPFYAYGAELADIEAVMRLSAVKRWHMLDTSRSQTLAEHSANVAMLAYLIAMKAPAMYFGPATFVGMAALVHDIGEVFSGDTPTPTKNYGTSIRAVIKQLENRLTPEFFKLSCDRYTTLMIKMCDLADGIRFIRLHGIDITSRHAREGLERQLKKCYDDMEPWPPEVRRHVSSHTQFYAYEQS